MLATRVRCARSVAGLPKFLARLSRRGMQILVRDPSSGSEKQSGMWQLTRGTTIQKTTLSFHVHSTREGSPDNTLRSTVGASRIGCGRQLFPDQFCGLGCCTRLGRTWSTRTLVQIYSGAQSPGAPSPVGSGRSKAFFSSRRSRGVMDAEVGEETPSQARLGKCW